MALQPGKPMRVFFSGDFVQTDQDVKDLSVPRPETNWCLLELPPAEIEALEAGKSLSFRERSEGGSAGARGEGSAALCTEKATFSLEFLENSNSIFLGCVDDSAEGGSEEPGGAQSSPPRCSLFAQCRGQIILKSAKVDAQRVRELLAPFTLGQARSGEAPPTMDTLQYGVAASPAELRQILSEGAYVEFGGGWWLLPPSLEREILDAAITIVTAFAWRPEAVNGEALLHEVRRHLGDDGEASVPSLAVLEKALRSILAEPAAADAGGGAAVAEKTEAATKPAVGAATAAAPAAAPAPPTAAATPAASSATVPQAAATAVDTSAATTAVDATLAASAPAAAATATAVDTAPAAAATALDTATGTVAPVTTAAMGTAIDTATSAAAATALDSPAAASVGLAAAATALDTGAATTAVDTAAASTALGVAASTALDATAAAFTALDTGAAGATGDPAASAAVAQSAPQSQSASAVLRLDKAKMNRARALQLLQEPPSQVREKFRLPAPEPRAKRPRLTGGAAGGRDGQPLRVDEFVAAFRELTDAGPETSEQSILEAVVGHYAYVDDIEGTIHPLDTTLLPQEPRERLERLFELLSHWKPERLASMIAPVLGGGQKVDPWLMKHTRNVFVDTADGEMRMLVKKFGAV